MSESQHDNSNRYTDYADQSLKFILHKISYGNLEVVKYQFHTIIFCLQRKDMTIWWNDNEIYVSEMQIVGKSYTSLYDFHTIKKK